MADKATTISDQIKRLDLTSQVLGRRELKELPTILWDDEHVLDIVQGFYGSGTGILVATQKRLVFIDKGMLYGLKVEDFPLDKISSIQYETGMMLATIAIFTSGNKAVIKNVDKTRARTFAEGVRARISAKSVPPPASSCWALVSSFVMSICSGLAPRLLAEPLPSVKEQLKSSPHTELRSA